MIYELLRDCVRPFDRTKTPNVTQIGECLYCSGSYTKMMYTSMSGVFGRTSWRPPLRASTRHEFGRASSPKNTWTPLLITSLAP